MTTLRGIEATGCQLSAIGGHRLSKHPPRGDSILVSTLGAILVSAPDTVHRKTWLGPTIHLTNVSLLGWLASHQ